MNVPGSHGDTGTSERTRTHISSYSVFFPAYCFPSQPTGTTDCRLLQMKKPVCHLSHESSQSLHSIERSRWGPPSKGEFLQLSHLHSQVSVQSIWPCWHDEVQMGLGRYTSFYSFKAFHSFQCKWISFHDKKSRMKCKNQKQMPLFTPYLPNQFPNLKVSSMRWLWTFQTSRSALTNTLMPYKHMQSHPWTLPTNTILTSVMGCTVNPKILSEPQDS